MLRLAQQLSVHWLWLGMAIGAGLIAALPLESAFLILACVALGILSLLDLRVAVAVTLILAPLKALIETELAVRLPVDIGQIAFALTVSLWLIKQVAAQQCVVLPRLSILVPLAIFIFAAALSLLTANSVSATLNELIKWLQMALMALIAASLCQQYGIAWLLGALLTAACVQAIIGLYQFAGGSGAPHLWILDYRYFRAFGSFGQPNPFGAFMGMTLPLALGALFGALSMTWLGRGRQRIAWLWRSLWLSIAALLISAGLIASWSRGAWLGFGAALVTLIALAPRRLWQRIVITAVCASLFILAMLSNVVPSALLARFSDFAQDLTGFQDVRGVPINDANYATVERLAHWQAALSMADESPFFGVGFGGYQVAYPRHALVNWQLALGHAHNYYLNVLAETGAIGLVAYVSMWLAFGALGLRALRLADAFQRGVGIGVLAVWIHVAVHSLFDKLFVNNLFLHFGAMLGLIGTLVTAVNGVTGET
ncbi:MAG: O-antigen ligase family protein [Anaerolineae bacterium]|nr:O-antigen ligase family protein [Anaerolineae bacterium]